MSRPKSQKTLDLEAERDERRKRRAVKTVLKEHRQAEREQRKARHEAIVKGGPLIVKPEVDNFNYTEARRYDPLCFCEGCHNMRRESLMATDKFCVACESERKSK